MAFESGAISFSAIRDHINSYGTTVVSAGQLSFSNTSVRDLLSGPTATSGAPYAAGTQVSFSQARSQTWRVTITRKNASASTATYSIYDDAKAAPASGETGQWTKTNRPIAFTLTNSSTMRSPSGGTSSYALKTNSSSQSFPTGTTLSVVNNSGCYIVGTGGTGGTGAGISSSSAGNGGAGGRAIEARYNLSITNSGTIAGGGGGGGGGARSGYLDGEGFQRYRGGGGGGGGRGEGAGGNGGTGLPSGYNGDPGSFTVAGGGGSGVSGSGAGGDGGSYNTDGAPGTGSGAGSGGAAGAAIGKLSTVTVSSTGNPIPTPVTIT